MTKEPTPLEALYTLVSGAIYGITRITDEYLEYQHIIETALLKNVELELTSLIALKIIKEHFVNIGGTKGNFEGKKPTNEIVIALKDLPQEKFDLLKEVLQ